jgi:hypothetical protein
MLKITGRFLNSIPTNAWVSYGGRSEDVVQVSTKGCIDVADLIGKMILPNNRQKLKMGGSSLKGDQEYIDQWFRNRRCDANGSTLAAISN